MTYRVSPVTKRSNSEALLGTRTPDPFLTIENQDGRRKAVTGGKRLHYAWFPPGLTYLLRMAARSGFLTNGCVLGARVFSVASRTMRWAFWLLASCIWPSYTQYRLARLPEDGGCASLADPKRPRVKAGIGRTGRYVSDEAGTPRLLEAPSLRCARRSPEQMPLACPKCPTPGACTKTGCRYGYDPRFEEPDPFGPAPGELP